MSYSIHRGSPLLTGKCFLDDYKNYPEANKVLDKVFFIGAAPHYTEPVFEYIEQVIKNFK